MTMKSTAIPVALPQFASSCGLAARLPYFLALMKPRVMALAVFTALVGLRVDDLARVPLAFPTYTGNLAYAAAGAARELDLHVGWQATEVEGSHFGVLRHTMSASPLPSSPRLRHPQPAD
jgi:hypothetical protein